MKTIWEKNKIVTLLGMLMLGFMVFGGWAYNTMQAVKINGEQYNRIVQGKDLIADILPPPQYIIESYLVTLQMINETDRNKLSSYIERGKQFRRDFEERHSYWGKELADGSIKSRMMEAAYRPALAFYDARDGQFIPALQTGDVKKAQDILRDTMTPNYEKHRAAIDEIVPLATQRNKDNEAAAAALLGSRLWQLVGLGMLLTAGIFFLCWQGVNSDKKRVKKVAERVEQLRSLCITNLGKATEAMKNGDLKFAILTGTPFFESPAQDEMGQLEASINGIIKQTQGTVASFEESRHIVLSLIEENAKLTDAARNGKLGTRADAQKFAGSYSTALNEMNELLDVVCTRVKNVGDRVEQLRSLCITNLGKATEAMKNGNLKFEIVTGTPFFEIKSDDEIGKLEASVNGIITQTKGTVASFEDSRRTVLNLIEETGRLAVAVREGQLQTRGEAQSFAGNYRELLQNVNELVEGVATPLSEVSNVMGQVARQNLTARVQGQYKGEYEQVKQALNQACEALEQTLSQVSSAAEQVNSAANEINSGSQVLAQGASEQASSLEEVSSSLQEMSSMIKQNAANAKEARGLTEAARQSADKGVMSMQQLSEAVNRIKQSSDATAKIVKTIDEIAFQTNLLALNAAVEAARAGDAGKGFAVVAEEVRNLAMRSAEAAKNTAELIEGSVKHATEGVTINQEVMANLEEINKQVNQVTEVMTEIAAASDQQSQGVEQINVAITQMNQVTQQTAANSEESAATAEELSGQSEEMLSLVATFQISQSGPKRSKPARTTFAPKSFAPKPMAKAKGASSTRTDSAAGGDLIPFDSMDEAAPLQEF